jgi:hypothetical protein
MLKEMIYSALKREASQKWFKRKMIQKIHLREYRPSIKPKNPLGSEWVLKNK